MDSNFQTPPIVADHMAAMIPGFVKTVLEPTPGQGNLVAAVKRKYGDSMKITAPERFEDINPNSKFDATIMNPPFTPMALGYEYLEKCMEMSDMIVALLPWFILINSQKRLDAIMKYGLMSVTNIPRKTFPCTRIQCCILHLNKGYIMDTKFKTFNW